MQGLHAPVSFITIKELPLILLLIDRALLSAILYDYYYYSSRQLVDSRVQYIFV